MEIRETATRRLVTAIKVLSPTNKRGEGRKEYRRKRRRILLSTSHLLEIDLLRQGQRVPMQQRLPNAPYFVLLNRAEERPISDVWPIHLGEALPSVPVPLLPGDADVPLGLQQALTNVYDLLRYDLAIDYARPPESLLPPQLTAWAEKLLSARGAASVRLPSGEVECGEPQKLPLALGAASCVAARPRPNTFAAASAAERASPPALCPRMDDSGTGAVSRSSCQTVPPASTGPAERWRPRPAPCRGNACLTTTGPVEWKGFGLFREGSSQAFRPPACHFGSPCRQPRQEPANTRGTRGADSPGIRVHSHFRSLARALMPHVVICKHIILPGSMPSPYPLPEGEGKHWRGPVPCPLPEGEGSG